MVQLENKDVSKARQKLREKPSKHDALHMIFDTCYCMNKCCWYSWYHRRENGEKVLVGICICPDCPCDSPRLAGISGGFGAL